MDTIVASLFSAVRLGDPVTAHGLSILPVLGSLPPGPDYITLARALESGALVVEELGSGASVSEVTAVNSGAVAVLALDGEELRGAKQNRLLNTTILIGPGKKVSLPVSCTERGRWHHVSARFADSGNVASREVRRVAKESVTANARAREGFHSDQGRVWAEVDALADRSCASSDTSAMRDVVESRRLDLDEFVAGFPLVPGQIGLLTVLGGRVMGMDVTSRAEAYSELHERLVASYAFEALLSSVEPGPTDATAAKEFIVSLADLHRTEHRSPGSGRSHRFSGSGVVGDALTYRGDVLHAAFFTTQAATPPQGPAYRSGMARARDRRRNLGG